MPTLRQQRCFGFRGCGNRPTDRHSDAEWGGWLNYLGLIRSLVEFGLDWLPPIRDITQEIALYYAAVIWAHQDELLGEGEWGES